MEAELSRKVLQATSHDGVILGLGPYHLPPRRHGDWLILHRGRLIGGYGCSWLNLIPEHCHVALRWREHSIARGEWHCHKAQDSIKMALPIPTVLICVNLQSRSSGNS